MATTFSPEEKLDLLFKKVAYGKAKGGTSDTTAPPAEGESTYQAIDPTSIWADLASVPASPTGFNTTDYVDAYSIDANGSTATVPLELSPMGSSFAMPTYTAFKRQWKAASGDWLGLPFGYAIKVYVGSSGWNGTTASMVASGITNIAFGDDPSKDWYFDYEAGVLYWTNENDESTSATGNELGISNNFTTDFDDADVIYITGHRYIGSKGAGGISTTLGTSAATAADITAGVLTFTGTANKALVYNGGGTAAEWRLLLESDISDLGAYALGSALTSEVSRATTAEGINATNIATNVTDIADEITRAGLAEGVNAAAIIALQSDVDGNESDADTAIGVVQADVDANQVTAATASSTNATNISTNATDISNRVVINSAASLASLTISGDLVVNGDSFVTSSGEVYYADTLLSLNVNSAYDTDTELTDDVTANVDPQASIQTGIQAFFGVEWTGGTAGTWYSTPQFVYDSGTSGTKGKWKAVAYDVGSPQVAASPDVYDNAALIFDVSDVTSGTQSDHADTGSSVTIPDADNANAAAVRHLGQVAKCSIEVTTTVNGTAGASNTNYAPVEGGAAGYPVKHNLGASSIYVTAIKTMEGNGSGGSQAVTGGNFPIVCKYKVIDDNSVRVTVGATADGDKYDIIVIG